MITTAKNKNELIEGLKREKDFNVLAVHSGPAATVVMTQRNLLRSSC